MKVENTLPCVLNRNREVSFLHYEGEGDALAIAMRLTECWSKLTKWPSKTEISVTDPIAEKGVSQ
jgi:hypothetical protein